MNPDEIRKYVDHYISFFLIRNNINRDSDEWLFTCEERETCFLKLRYVDNFYYNLFCNPVLEFKDSEDWYEHGFRQFYKISLLIKLDPRFNRLIKK